MDKLKKTRKQCGKRRTLQRFALFLGTLFLISIMAGCSKKEKESADTKTNEEQSETAVQEKSEDEFAEYTPQVRKILQAIEKTSRQSAFDLDTAAVMKLNGNIIKGEYTLNNSISVLQEKKSDMEMVMESTSSMDDIVSKAYYKDGWYYTDDANGKKKVEKSSEEVLQNITEITALVKEQAENIDQIQEAENGDVVSYTYHIPESAAEFYINQLAESAIAQDSEISGAKVRVDDILLTSVINQNGTLDEQRLTINGTVKKSLFKVPVEAEAAAVFSQRTEKSLSMPDFSEFQE